MTAAAPLPEPLLLDYACGTASPAISLLMATHLALSSEGRELFALLQSLGGALLEELEDEPLERISADGALALAERPARLPDHPTLAQRRPDAGAPPGFRGQALPLPLRQADAGGRWQTLGIGVAAKRLPVSTDGDRAHLLWARGGTGIASHRHVGREVVLVLEGAFWDEGVRYAPGDVSVNEDGTVHAPRIDSGADCLCLAVTEAPVRFTGPLGLILNRFSRF
jgi:putative transcriptional regulator